MGRVFGFWSGTDIVSAIFSLSQGFSWSAAGRLALGLVGAAASALSFSAVAGALGFSVSLNVAGLVVVGLGILGELFTRIVYHRSLFGIITTKMSNVMSGLGSSLSAIPGAFIGFFMGMIKAMMAHTPEDLATGAVMAGASFMTLGTGVMAIFITAASFFTPAERSAYFGSLYTDIQKKVELLDPQTLKVTYTITYSQELDKNGQPFMGDVEGKVTTASLYDSFKGGLTGDDVTSKTYPLTDGSNSFVFDDYPFKIRISHDFDIYPNSLLILPFTIPLNRPLEQIIGADGKLCNAVTLTGRLPSFNPFSNTTNYCINAKGEQVLPDDAQSALTLFKSIVSCYYENDPYVKYANCDTECGFSTRFSDECVVCMKKNCQVCGAINTEHESQAYMCMVQDAGIDKETADIVSRSVWDYGHLQCVGYVRAVEQSLGRNFIPPQTPPSPPNLIKGCAKYYATYDKNILAMKNVHFIFHGIDPQDTGYIKQLLPGDILILDGSSSTECGHVAIFLYLGPNNELYVTDGNSKENPGAVFYDQFGGVDDQSIPPDFPQILGYYRYEL